ncbi:molybdopterin-dependent oxidoreductase [Persephonella atlantica]|uniref:Molybdopterin-dependent oxidoreductase n=1 Tax=Persephonella atlantica TaxID=2699429 RepID=A0ABS1GH42_9AQUI|nr:molybdopterin-dependent oxidoreductase [Persephonella atlantica]MBK3332251.1 molybdopterin-dependent oxidoreductase [Persephonella atlantica]
MEQILATAQCPYCGVGCGLEIFKDKKGRIKIRGDKTHPATKGDLCLKPIPLPKVMDIGRVPAPLYRESKKEQFREISWEEAFQIIANRIKENKPDENYFYISGQLTTEDSYVINKFVKGFVRTNNIDANSRLCMASAVMGYKLSFGSDGPPGSYEDIDDADAFVFAGSNAAWTHPVLFKRVLNRKKDYPQGKIIVIDPVYTATAEKADLWIDIKPGTDTALFNSVLYLLNKKGWIDYGFVSRYTEGFSEALEEAEKFPPEKAAQICGIKESKIYRLAEIYAFSKKVISFWTMGLNQSSNGTMKNLSLINLHLATGRLNEKGCPFSLTGQPNAMGGREVGYLVNGLPGYRDVRNEEDRRFMEQFWEIPEGSIKEKPGKTVVEAVDEMINGQIKLLWIVCTNPAVTMPNLNKFWRALRNTFVVVQDAYLTDSVDYANLVLPATQWGEKEGVMTGSDRTITYNRAFKQPPPQCKHDWEIFCQVAKKMGWGEFFDYKNSREIFNEFKKTTKGRLCDVSYWDYEDLPKQWGGRWLYKDLKFPTPSGKAKFNKAQFEPPADKLKYPYSFVLTTGRTKKQWHTMTRTGKSHELLRDESEPFILLSEEDAFELGIMDNDYINIRSVRGQIYIKAKIGKIKKGVVFSPFGYGKIYHFPANILVSDALDPVSKEPELKFSSIFIKARKKRIYKLSDEVYNRLKETYQNVELYLDDAIEKGLICAVSDENIETVKSAALKMKELINLFVNKPADWEKALLINQEVAGMYIKLGIEPSAYRKITQEFVKALGSIYELPEETLQVWEYAHEFLSHGIFEIVKRHYEEALKK